MNQEKILKLQYLATQGRKNGLRHGQALMNALWEVSPETYAIVKETAGDCFYDDSRISLFWEAISYEGE